MKIYLTSGHQIINKKGNGAFGVDGFDEAVEARKLVTDVINYMTYSEGFNHKKILTDNDSWSLSTVVNWLQKKVTSKCLTIEIHFNAFSKPSATGAEVLVANDANDIESDFGRRLSVVISSTLGIVNRGLKKESASHRGRLAILSGGGSKAINLLPEICFITNPDDVRVYRNKYWTLVEKLAKLIIKFSEELEYVK